jgi:hypothetical protein
MGRQRDTAERRKHERVPADVPFRLKAAGVEDTFDLVDLSESGVRIRCRRSLPAMARILVSLVLPGKRVQKDGDVRLETTGVVVWSHRASDVPGGAAGAAGGGPAGPSYDTGVFFSELDDRQRGLLRSFVGSHALG